MMFDDNFAYIFIKIYVVGANKNQFTWFTEAILVVVGAHSNQLHGSPGLF